MKTRSVIVLSLVGSAAAQEYSTCATWNELVEGKDVRFALVVRVSNPGTKDRPALLKPLSSPHLGFLTSAIMATSLSLSSTRTACFNKPSKLKPRDWFREMFLRLPSSV